MNARLGPYAKQVLLAMGLCLICVSACYTTTHAEQERRREFARLDQAIKRLQSADNADKQKPLIQLRRTPCQELCALRKVCDGAYSLHQMALAELAEAKAGMGQPKSEVSIALRLEKARKKLEQARPELQKCAAEQGALERELSR